MLYYLSVKTIFVQGCSRELIAGLEVFSNAPEKTPENASQIIVHELQPLKVVENGNQSINLLEHA